MAKRGDWLKNQTAERRAEIAASGGERRAALLTKRQRQAISDRASGAWSAQQKAKKQALSKP